jgi:DNA polymerase-3 subunit chi
MRVDFYELGSFPVERTLPLLAQKACDAGHRLLVVSQDKDQLARISEALWSHRPESFLAHGRAGEDHEEEQPILLSATSVPANGARVMAIADGIWREADPSVERILFLFGDARVEEARQCWRDLAGREALERHIWKRRDGNWVEGR